METKKIPPFKIPIPQYMPFDYFSTPLYMYIGSKRKYDDYGITELEVNRYISRMRQDRDNWSAKERFFKGWDGVIQLIFALILPFGGVMSVAPICNLFGIYDYDSFSFEIISDFMFFLVFLFEIFIWKYDLIIKWLNAWLEKLFKKRTQHNPLIEKYLDDCNWDEYQERILSIQEHNRIISESESRAAST